MNWGSMSTINVEDYDHLNWQYVRFSERCFIIFKSLASFFLLCTYSPFKASKGRLFLKWPADIAIFDWTAAFSLTFAFRLYYFRLSPSFALWDALKNLHWIGKLIQNNSVILKCKVLLSENFFRLLEKVKARSSDSFGILLWSEYRVTRKSFSKPAILNRKNE